MTKFNKFATALIAALSFGAAGIAEAPALAGPKNLTKQQMDTLSPVIADYMCNLARQNSAAFGNAAYNHSYGHRAAAVQFMDAWVLENRPGLIASEREYGFSIEAVLVQPAKERIMRTCT